MTLFVKLMLTLFVVGFLLLFFSDCAPRRELLYKYLGLLCMTPAVTITIALLFAFIWGA